MMRLIQTANFDKCSNKGILPDICKVLYYARVLQLNSAFQFEAATDLSWSFAELDSLANGSPQTQTCNRFCKIGRPATAVGPSITPMIIGDAIAMLADFHSSFNDATVAISTHLA